jgi:hydrogenase maturation protein HypF
MEIKKIRLPFKIKRPILALGGQAKNTACFASGNCAYISQVYSDLSNPKDFFNFEKALNYFLKKNPKIIACDLHPEYQSTKYVQDLRLATGDWRLIQHHHAHIASCMADNCLENQKVIGVAFDGTGLGNDNTLWGAEFLICDYKNFTRKAHLQEIPLLGGERAILEPWRLAAIWLYLIYKDKFLNLNLEFVKGIDKKKWQVLENMYLSEFNSPLASSMGRLFDAIASLILVKYKANFEAELAIELEKMAVRSQNQRVNSYSFKITKEKNNYIIDPRPMFKEIVEDLRNKKSEEIMAGRFHLTVAKTIKKTCLILRKETGIYRVVLSGGCFQNKLLLRLSLGLLNKENFRVFTHQKLSCNDSSLSLGQVAIANARS